MKKLKLNLTYNAPFTLTFFFVCAVTLILELITHKTNALLFSVRGFSFSQLLSFVRLFTHVLGHQNIAHFVGNMMYLLLLGPLLEERYGVGVLLMTTLATAFVTGVLACLFSVSILGASGVVFAFILMTSFTAFRQHTLPLTVVLVAVLYLGNEIYQMIAVGGNVAYFAHIAGGLVGAVMGYLLNCNKHN